MLLDRLEEAGGPAGPVPSADGWELVLAENVAYLADDQRRWQALADLRRLVGLEPTSGCSPGWGMPRRPAPTPPATGRLRPRRAPNCPPTYHRGSALAAQTPTARRSGVPAHWRGSLISAIVLIVCSSPQSVPLVLGNTAPRRIDTRRPPND
jgi:hypothetical protein